MPVRPVAPRMIRILKKHPIAAIAVAALITVAALFSAIYLSGVRTSRHATVEESAGVYDLRDFEGWVDTVVDLPPGESYYPDVYLMPGAAAVAEPTTRYGERRTDYLSQRFRVRLPDTGDVYALTFHAEGRQAMRVYVNGSLAGQNGVPGVSKASAQVGASNMTCYAAAQGGEMDIILHVAQFHHYRYTSGVVLVTLSLQRAADGGWKAGVLELNKELLVTGALLCAAALLFCVYLLRRNSGPTLYFALACLTMALRERLQSTSWLYFPLFSGNMAFMLKYLSLALLTVFLTLYLGQFVSKGLLLYIKRAILAGSAAYGSLVILGDSLLYTQALLYYQIVLVGCIAVGITGLFVTMRRPSPEQAAALYGMAVFYVAAVWDMFLSMWDAFVPNSQFASIPKDSVSEAAMVVFVLAETISIFLMNNRLIAEARQAEQALAVEKAALQKLNQMKTEFLGNVSHELKTPLTVVSGYAQTARQLFERSGEVDRREAVRRMELISSEAERLSLMVGQVLDVTRIEEGAMAIEPVPCHLDEIIQRSVDTYYPILNKNVNRLEIRIDSMLPSVHADPARISQVIINLVANAVRHTQGGVITVTAQLEDAFVRVSVSDTGAGIAREKLALLFERYNNRGGKDTGTGLGLYICRHIVEAHGGSIRLESKVSKGTTVSFTLPVHKG